MKNISISRMSWTYLLIAFQLLYPAQQQKSLIRERDALRFRHSYTIDTLGQQVARSHTFDQARSGQTRYMDPRSDIIKPLTPADEQALLARWNTSGIAPTSPHFSHLNHLGPPPAKYGVSLSKSKLDAIERMKQQSAEWFKTIGPAEKIKILNRYCINYTQALDRLRQYLPQEYIKHHNRLRTFANNIATAQFNPAQMIEALEQNVEIKTGAATMDAHINRPILEFKAKLVKILFNPDGSYKGFSNDRALREYAKITAEFLRDYIYADNMPEYAQIIGKLSQAGFTAFDYFAGSVGGTREHLRHGTFAFIHSFQGFNPYKALQSLQGVKQNAFNNDIKQLQRYLENGQFTKAKALLQKYGTSTDHCTALNGMYHQYLRHYTHNAFERAGTYIKHIDLSRLTTDQKSKIIAFVEQQNNLSKAGLHMFQKLYIAGETNFGLFIHQLDGLNDLAFDASTQRELQGIAAQMDPRNLIPENIDTYCFQIGRDYFQLTEAQATQYAKCITKYFEKGDVSLNDFIYSINARIKSNLADINKFCQDIKRQYRIGMPEKDILSEAHLNSRGIKHAETVEDTQRILITQIADNISLSMITQTAETLEDPTLPAPSLESSTYVTSEYDPSRFQSVMVSSPAASSSSSSSQPSSSSAGLATESQSRTTTSVRDIAEVAFECDRLGIPYPWLPQQVYVPAEDKSDLVLQSTGAERYSVVEYIKQTDKMLANMEEGPAQIAAKQIRDIIATQWEDIKVETKLLLEQTGRIGVETLDQVDLIVDRALCNIFGIPVGDMSEIASSEDASALREMFESAATRIHNVAQAVEGLGHLFMVNVQDFRENFKLQGADLTTYNNLIAEGKITQATLFRSNRQMLKMLESPRIKMLQEKVVHNLKHPVTFLGRMTRGIIGTTDLAKNVATESIKYDLSTPAEQQAMREQLQQSYDNLITIVKNVTPERMDEIVSSFVADCLTLDIVKNAAQLGRALKSSPASSSSSSSSSSGTGIVPQQSTAVPSSPGSFAKSEPPAIRVSPRLIAAQQARQRSGTSASSSSSSKTVVVDDKGKGRAPQLTKEQKAQQKALRAKERYYLKQHQEEQKRLCPEHGVRTAAGGRHELTVDQKPEGWHDVVPGDLEHEILAKPFDYTRHTHVHPDLPAWMNENPRPIKINYEHITSPDLKSVCKKGEISRSGFHHDPGRRIERSGMIEVKDMEMLPHGCYQFEWRSCGSTFKPSTMFPESWTRAQTIEKIYESMDNTSNIKKINDHRYRHLGFTSEGIEILSIIEVGKNAAKVISAYPWFPEH